MTGQMPKMRRVVLVAVAGACLAIPSAAHPQGASTTASGTMLGVSNELQIVSQTNGDGTVTKCGVIGGTLRTETRDINFGAGGPLSPEGTLDPSTQALVDTIREGSLLGTAAVTTITYEEVGTLCGHSGTVVTGASLRVLPTPTPTPTPRRQRRSRRPSRRRGPCRASSRACRPSVR